MKFPGYHDMPEHARLNGRLLIVGFGSIGQGVLPLILRHIGVPAAQIRIVTATDDGRAQAEAAGAVFLRCTLTPDNHRAVLEPLLAPGDFLLNLSVDVSSLALVRLCQQRGALYLDTCIEPWAGGYADPALSPAERSNYALREAALALRAEGGPGAPTAVVTHGANPGLVSHFVKRALLDLARDSGVPVEVPAARAGWAALAQQLGVRVIHIAERDTQVPAVPKQPGEFVNTWSVAGFVGEGLQPAELGWGSHERTLPPDGRRHTHGSGAAIWLERPGASVRVRSWTPLAGPYHGFLITHGEAISLADALTVRAADGTVSYRPTVHYAYHPCDAAVLSLHELAGRTWQLQDTQRLIVEEIVEGRDELGVLLLGHARGAYWYGSRLDVTDARAAAPHNSATSLQVTAGVLAGMVWALEHPDRGLVEPEDMDFRRVLELAAPYLGELVGAYSDWTPLAGRSDLFPEPTIADDPWQFANFRVH